ncbi:M50 family metallopeptidase [Mycobacterium persicum]|uniref:M50 family metallopeptidase n=1 Tax=Mycobacterium persicum TaxID=1487726 RepID=UPI0009F30DB8|nr:M50 family metallopeptidase [Mycobacterium persicum]ORB51420.1 hypothetical protein BST40_10435 [Mycobacterium persicum]
MTGTVTRGRRRRPLAWADLTAREQMSLRTAIHEAGHAVAGTVVGGRIRSAVLSDSRVTGLHGLTSYETVPEGTWASVLFAGPWSEARWLAGRRPSPALLSAILGGSGYRDHNALCTAAASDVWTDTTSEARLTVPPLMEMTWDAVISVAKVIHREGEARHEHVLAALGIDDGGGPGSVQLANLRAGLRRVPALTT